MQVWLRFRKETFTIIGERLVASHPTDTNLLVFEAELRGSPRQICVPGVYCVEISVLKHSQRGHPYYNGWPHPINNVFSPEDRELMLETQETPHVAPTEEIVLASASV